MRKPLLPESPAHSSFPSPLSTKGIDITAGAYIPIYNLTVENRPISPVEKISQPGNWQLWGDYFGYLANTQFDECMFVDTRQLVIKNDAVFQNQIPELIAHLRAKGFSKEADRVSQLHIDENSIEPGDQPMAAESLKGLILFLNYHKGLVTRHLVLRSDGRLQLEWPGNNGKYLVITLMDENTVRYIAVSRDNKRNKKKKIASGTCHYEDTFTDLAPQKVNSWVSWEAPKSEISLSYERELTNLQSTMEVYLGNSATLDTYNNFVRAWLVADSAHTTMQKNWDEAFEERQTAA